MNQIKLVSDFEELIHFNFHDDINAVGWKRSLEGNFAEIVSKLQLKENITEISVDDLLQLELSEEGNKAREIIISDIKSLTEFGASPSLNLLKKYERDLEFDFISTDVYSFHVDRSPIATSTFLCTYFGSSSDIISNRDAVQKVVIPEVRTKLEQLHDGEREDFDTFLTENYFDLHYEPNPDSQPINLGVGNLWRLSVDHPQQKVPPCIHRAPLENENYRLLLIC